MYCLYKNKIKIALMRRDGLPNRPNFLKNHRKMPKNAKKWVKNCVCPPPHPPPRLFKKDLLLPETS